MEIPGRPYDGFPAWFESWMPLEPDKEDFVKALEKWIDDSTISRSEGLHPQGIDKQAHEENPDRHKHLRLHQR